MTHAPYARVKVETKKLEASLKEKVTSYQEKEFRFLRTVEADEVHQKEGHSYEDTMIDVLSADGFVERLLLPEEAITEIPW